MAMIRFVGIGAGLAATTKGTLQSTGAYAWLGTLLTVPFAAILVVGGAGRNIIDRAYPPPADTEREPPARR